MQEISDILNWSFIPSNLRDRGGRIFTHETKTALLKNISKINIISERSASGLSVREKKLLKNVYDTFQQFKDEDFEILLSKFTKKDARLLAWCIDYHPENGELPIISTNDFETVLDILFEYWRDSFIIILFHVLLKNWNSLIQDIDQRELLVSTLETKLEEYEGSRKDILNFRDFSHIFFSLDSPKLVAGNLIEHGTSILFSNQVINLKEHTLVYDFFSEIVLSYLKQITGSNIKSNTLTDVYSFLNKNNNKRTTLLACSEIINSEKFSSFRIEIKDKTIELVGDPINLSNWQYNGLVPEEEIFVEKARKKINAWLNRELIKVFFEKLVQDPRRKKYWLKLIDEISDIKFIGNRYNYKYLKNIENISKNVDSRYKITNSNQATSALVMYSRGFVFAEFTDTGALYIYKERNFKVNLNRVSSMADLKTWPTSMFACRNSEMSGYVDLNEEGRITHQGNWESRFDIWMRNYYKQNISNTTKEVGLNKTTSENDDNYLDPTIKGKNYNPSDPDARWQSVLLYWSKKYRPGYTYSSKKDAWFKKK